MTMGLATFSRSRRIPRRATAFAVVASGSILACAVSVPPTGGPEDTTPPRVATTVPARDSSGVDAASPIAITFSDDMTRARVERSVTVNPPITFDRIRWEGRTLVIVPAGGLQRDTTYVVRVKPGYRDNHGVPSKASYEFAFATGAEMDTARVEGTVFFKREPSGRAVVRCFRLPLSDDFHAAVARPHRETTTAADGTYRLRYLPDNDARFVLFAFIDVNGNGMPDAAGEPAMVHPDTVLLTKAVPVVRAVDFKVIDPNEPAVVSGTVGNETGIDSVKTSVLIVAVADSTRAPLYGVCDEAGAYEFRRVPAGDYVVRAFLDLRADSVCGTWECPDTARTPCPEPCVETPDTLRVEPGAAVTVPRLVLPRKESP